MAHRKGLSTFCFLLLATVALMVIPKLNAQAPIYKPGEYPAPRYPKLKAHYTVDDLMPIARELVRRPIANSFLLAGYNIQKGQRALIVVPRDFDGLVVEAISRAIRERGGQADVVFTDVSEESLKPVADGSAEVHGILEAVPVDQEGNPITPVMGFSRNNIIRLAESSGFDILIYGAGGPHNAIKIPWQYIFWDRVDKFVTGASFPAEVQEMIDKVAWATLIDSKKVHARDPEGTDITWTVKPNYWEEAKKTFGMDIVHSGHISAIALGMDPSSFMEQDATGVIAGTINHQGAFPHVRVAISKTNATGVEGGGKYGELWREALAKWQDVQWPGVPGPGINKLKEVAIGTQPKSARPQDYMLRGGGANSWERSRSGVIHWGIGAIVTFLYEKQMPKEFAEFRKEHTVPEGHVHVHTYFTTMELTKPDGKVVELIHQGRLTALDDPRVRQVAAKYGDPDEILKETWIPAIPGINVQGNYWTEYANDPRSYIRKDIDENYTKP